MPNRILRDWTTSETVDRLTTEQENAFTRLLMAVDDFGRYHADPRLLLARLYPLRVGTTSAQQMHSIRNALASHGLVTIYTIEGRDYLQVVKWHNVPRAKESKFPACIADAVQLHSICTASAPVTVTVTGTDDRKPIPEPKPSLDHLQRKRKSVVGYPIDFETFWTAYPRKVGKDKALDAWNKASHKPDVSAIVAKVEAYAQTAQWTRDGGQFIPHPATWLNQGRWADEVTTNTTELAF